MGRGLLRRGQQVFCSKMRTFQGACVKKGGAWRIGATAIIVIIATVTEWCPLALSRSAAAAETMPTATALSCAATSSLGSTGYTQSSGWAVTDAPAQSLPGKTFTVAISDPGETLPATLQGYPVTSESSVQVAFAVSDAATLVSATLQGGSNVGTGATIATAADPSNPGQTDVIETVPGPIAAGQTFSMPTIDLTLAASTTSGANITAALLDVQPEGSVSSDPALSSTMQVAVPGTGSVDVASVCWPASAVSTALSSTTIVAVDTTPPAITITSPADGAVYSAGQVVDAGYDCTDVASYGVATCSGPVASGSAIDTTFPGEHSFRVTATDERGTPAQQVVSYYVRAAQGTNVIGPIDVGTLPLASGASCSFGGTGCESTTSPEATYKVVAPVANGAALVMGDSFFVEWQIYEPGGYSATGQAGPQLNWTLPAPAGAVIDGPVTTSAIGLLSPALGQGSLTGAGACSSVDCDQRTTAAGALVVNGVIETGLGWTYHAIDQPSLSMTWDEASNPVVGTDGLYLDVRYTVKVTTPGIVTLPGFPALTGSEGVVTAAIGTPTPQVSFTVVDPTPPTVAVTTPANGGVYSFGQVVNATYSCADAIVTVTSCSGSVSDGAPIDTSTATPRSVHTFMVTATDSVGNTATTEVEYYVEAKPPVAGSQSFAVPLGSTAKLPVVSGDTATDFPLDPRSITIVAPPSDGTATPNADGTVTFTDDPTLTFKNYLQSGNLNDSFTYSVTDTDGNVSNTATVNLTVLPKLVVTSIDPPLAQGLTLKQSQEQPTDSLGSIDGTSCSSAGVRLNGQAQGSCGELAPVTVTNDGGVNTGWSLSGQVSDFLDPSAPPATICDAPADFNDLCIPGGDLGWFPSASVVSVFPGSAAVVLPGDPVAAPSLVSGNQASGGGDGLLTWGQGPAVSSPGASIAPPSGLHDLPRVLCQAPKDASEGAFRCGANLSLPVPASTAASKGGGFGATLTLTLTVSYSG